MLADLAICSISAYPEPESRWLELIRFNISGHETVSKKHIGPACASEPGPPGQPVELWVSFREGILPKSVCWGIPIGNG